MKRVNVESKRCSELIAKLQELMDEHGDLPVFCNSDSKVHPPYGIDDFTLDCIKVKPRRIFIEYEGEWYAEEHAYPRRIEL